MADEYSLGNRIREVRENRNMELKDLAERSGMEEVILQGLESGELFPSLSPLIRIARGLGVRLGTFLDDSENLGPLVVRRGEARKALRFSDKEHASSSDLDFFSLASGKSGRHMEPFVIDIHESSAEQYKASSHEGEEFIYVLEGRVEVTYGKETFSLEPGESIYYDSIVPHHVHSPSGESAKILAVVYAPL